MRKAGGDEGVPPRSLPSPMQQQMVPEDPSALPEMNADLRRHIAQSAKAGPPGVPQDLKDWIEAELIEPALKHAIWNVALLPPPFLTQPILAAIALAVVVAGRAYDWRRADEAACASG